MAKQKVEELSQKLIKSRISPWKEEEIENLWKPIRKSLTPEEEIQLLNYLIEYDNVFHWLKLISYLIPNLPPQFPIFVDLLKTVIIKTKGDMAQGIFIRSLINLGEKNPERGIDLFYRLLETSNDDTIEFSGLILGGASKKMFPATYPLIIGGLQHKKPSIQIASLKALRVTFETRKDSFPFEVKHLLESMWEKGDQAIRNEVIRAYIDFRKFEPDFYESRLVEIARRGDSFERATIINSLLFQDLVDKSKELEIFHLCSEDSDPRVTGSLMRVLSIKGNSFLEDSMEIIRRILKSGSSDNIGIFEYAVSKVCEDNWDYCNSCFGKWYESDKDMIFRFRLNQLTSRLPKAKTN